jgi:pyridoxal phosphate enzyme (YggS family)
VLAVSKGQPLHKIEALYAQGQRDFGENYAGEMIRKMDALANKCPEIHWHFIGQIQTNKIEQIARANIVQSVSKIKQIDRLSKATHHEKLGVFIQVNLDKDPARGGALPEEIPALQEAILKQPNLKLMGLMAITPIVSETSHTDWFKVMKNLQLPDYPELSMGMSDDYEEAIKHGATWVRLGTALFGPRKNKAEGYPESLYNLNGT